MKRAFSLLANFFGAPSATAASNQPLASHLSPDLADTAIDVSRIVPIIKSRAWLLQSQADNAASFEYVTEDLNADLVVVYVEDENKNLRYLSAAQMAGIGMAWQEMRALALENLMRRLPQIRLHSTGPVSMLTAGGNYEASLLLVKDFWAGDKVQVVGEIVVAVPSRDVVLITGSANPEGLMQLKKLAQASRPARASFQLTQTLFVYRDGQFLPWGEPVVPDLITVA